MKVRKLEKCFVVSILTLCITLELLFMGYGEVVTKAEETELNLHTLSNPRYDADGNVTWDCVWFGSYPQTEIVSAEDSDQLAVMEKMSVNFEIEYETVSAASYQQIISASYNSNGDATVNGVKYRRMKKGEAAWIDEDGGHVGGHYQWTDNTSYHYFRYEPIKWRVLSTEENDAFLLSDMGLDNRCYNEVYAGVTWETCTIRSWLNGYSATANEEGINYSSDNFINRAFSDIEQHAIYNSTVLDDPILDTGKGNDTIDKLYLLSREEGLQKTYGFSEDCDIDDDYCDIDDKAKRVKTSTYAKAMGCSNYEYNELRNYTAWWLRSYGSYGCDAMWVNSHGYLPRSGLLYNSGGIAVRPVLHLDLSATSLYSYAGTVSSTDGEYTDNGSNGNENTEVMTQATTSQATNTQSVIKVQVSPASTATEEIDTGISQNSKTTNKANITAPAKVNGVTLSRAGSGKLNLSFKKVKKAKGYQISYGINKNFSKEKKFTTKKNKYTFKKLKKGKTYYVRVRAYKINGSKKVYGKWSVVKKIKAR